MVASNRIKAFYLTCASGADASSALATLLEGTDNEGFLEALSIIFKYPSLTSTMPSGLSVPSYCNLTTVTSSMPISVLKK